MAKRGTKAGRWTFAVDRRFVQVAASLKTVEAVANEMKRRPQDVARTARRLGVSLKRSVDGPKAKK
jgi:hypothetical protein